MIFIILATGGAATLHVYTVPLTPATAQLQFQESIIVATNLDPTPHIIKLKATQNSEQEAVTVSGFTVDTTNVLSAPMNSQVIVFVTDPLMSVLEAKVGLEGGLQVASLMLFHLRTFQLEYILLTSLQRKDHKKGACLRDMATPILVLFC